MHVRIECGASIFGELIASCIVIGTRTVRSNGDPLWEVTANKSENTESLPLHLIGSHKLFHHCDCEVVHFWKAREIESVCAKL
jgi:hypothetical protein